MQTNRLRQIGPDEPVNLIEPPVTAPAPPPPTRDMQALTGMLMLALKALSQRTVVALASLVDGAMIASAFALWIMVITQPTVLQLVGVGGYAVFILCAVYMRRRGQ